MFEKVFAPTVAGSLVCCLAREMASSSLRLPVERGLRRDLLSLKKQVVAGNWQQFTDLCEGYRVHGRRFLGVKRACIKVKTTTVIIVFSLFVLCFSSAAKSQPYTEKTNALKLLSLYAIKEPDSVLPDKWRGDVTYFAAFENDDGYLEYVDSIFSKINNEIDIKFSKMESGGNFFIFGSDNIFLKMPEPMYNILNIISNGDAYRYIANYEKLNLPCFLFIRRVYEDRDVVTSKDFAFIGVDLKRGSGEIKKCMGAYIFAALGFRRFDYSKMTNLGFSSIFSEDNIGGTLYPSDLAALRKIYVRR